MRDWYLGVDTSNYTTSLALINDQGVIEADCRKVLAVPEGARGLRQSEAVFQHVSNIPALISELPENWGQRLAGIGVSERPRRVEGSYMPVFRVGLTVANALSSALRCPLIHSTHQDGHIRAGLYNAKTIEGTEFAPESDFMAVHLSGGTTELLVIERQLPLRVQLHGGTSDLHAGQFVDRVGTRVGLSFPCGPHLEKLAVESDFELPISVHGLTISFSGPESAASRALDAGVKPSAVAWAVEDCIAKSLAKAVVNLSDVTDLTEILLVGGVASNNHVRSRMAQLLQDRGILLGMAKPRLSSDNAVGVAIDAKETVTHM